MLLAQLASSRAHCASRPHGGRCAQARGTGFKATVSLYSELAPAQKSSIKAGLVDKINSFAHKTWDWQCVDPTTASYGSKDEAQAVTLTVSISACGQEQGGANVIASVTSPDGTLCPEPSGLGRSSAAERGRQADRTSRTRP